MANGQQDIAGIVGAGRKRGRGRALLLALLLVVAAAAGWRYFSPAASPQQESLYETTPVRRGALTVTVTATGTVEPTNLVQISSELSGTVREVVADYNSLVKKDQPLAVLDTDKLESALAHSRAALEAARARVVQAEATVTETEEDFERALSLSERNVVSKSSLTTARAASARARAALDVARADVKVAEADLKTAETNLAKACICSPIDGVVLERNVEPGQIVASSLQAPVLFTIAEDLSRMQLQVAIDEADIGVIAVGKKARFTVEAYPGRSFAAEISQLRYAPQTVDGVVTYEAILTVDNRDLVLRPGMTATADILVEEIADALLVPNAGFRFSPPVAEEPASSGGGLLGFILPRPPRTDGPPPAARPDGTRILHLMVGGEAAPVAVKPGPSDGLTTAIEGGDIAEGDLVITSTATQ